MSETQALSLLDGITEIDRPSECIGTVVRDVYLVEIGLPVVDVEAPANPVFRVVRVGIAEIIEVLVTRGVDADTDPLAGTHKVVLLDIGAEDQAGPLGETGAGADTARRLLLDGVVDVDLIIDARYRGSIQICKLQF